MRTPGLKIANKFQRVCVPVAPAHPVPDIVDDAREGLLRPPRSLPPKYFYDEAGSLLFTKICETREYYPTRTEDRLLASHAPDIIRIARPGQIIELGSGNSQKTRRLFDACENTDHTCTYAPFDVCAPILEETADQLQAEYGWLHVTPLLGDYHAGLDHLPAFTGRRLFVFLGSTIGNFEPGEAHTFLREITAIMNPGDYLLIGADRVKDTRVLDSAYNDAEGITAAFNLNLLEVLNRELDADFNPCHFRHKAEFVPERSRIEMKLVCNATHQITLKELDETIAFLPDDEILTEVSYKFTHDGAEKLLEEGGMNVVKHYEPENRYFSLILGQFI